MKTDTSHLKKVSRYAKDNDMSVQNVYLLMKQGKIPFLIIDGVKFINIKPKTHA